MDSPLAPQTSSSRPVDPSTSTSHISHFDTQKLQAIMIASKIALASSLFLATAIAGGDTFASALGLDASQYRIARGSHDERGNKFALGLGDEDASQYRIARGSHDEPAPTDAGVDTVGKPKSLRGLNGVGTSPNKATEIRLILDADGTVPATKHIGRSIRLDGASAKVSQLSDRNRHEINQTLTHSSIPLDACWARCRGRSRR